MYGGKNYTPPRTKNPLGLADSVLRVAPTGIEPVFSPCPPPQKNQKRGITRDGVTLLKTKIEQMRVITRESEKGQCLLKKTAFFLKAVFLRSPNGDRTRIFALKGQCPNH